MNDQNKKRGFAALSPERVRELASRGGKAAHAAGTAHEWSSSEAMVAGSKGGKAVKAKKEALRAGILDSQFAAIVNAIPDEILT